MKTPKFIKRLGRCQCDKLSADHPLHHVPKPGFIERLLMFLLPHFDIVKTVENCKRCGDSGFDKSIAWNGHGSYDLVCNDCGGQSTQVKPATLLYLRRFYIFRAKWFGKWAAKHLGDVYLHHIVRDDDDPDPHNHPWGFTTVILAGGYIDEQFQWEPGSLKYVMPMAVMQTLPSPTLVVGDARFESQPGKRVFVRMQRVLPGMILRREAEHCHRVLVGCVGGNR